MATTRPSLCWPSCVVVVGSAVAVMAMLPSRSGGLVEVFRGSCVARLALAAGAQRFCATDDLHDLGGDRVLTGAVHHTSEPANELLRVVGRGFHCSLACGVLGCGRVQQRREHASLGVTRQQRVE